MIMMIAIIPAKDHGTSRQIPTAARRNWWPENMLEKLTRYLVVMVQCMQASAIQIQRMAVVMMIKSL
jgi:hypothetical protein